jgi:hypothetical protein
MGAVSRYGQSYWTELDKSRKEVKGFLKSLSPDMVGGGFVLYDPQLFILKPRSAYLNSPWTQRIVCVGTPDATFDHTQKAFMDLLAKSKVFKEQVEKFQPTRLEDCPVHSKRLLKKLIVIEQVIKKFSQPALDQLKKNYEGDKKPENATSLRKFGEEIFPILTDIKEIFIKKLIPHLPTIKDDISLQKFAFSARGILGRREDNIRHIREIRWASQTGVVVTGDFISDCLQDIAEKSSTTRGELQNAVNHIGYSHQAVEILAGYGAANWKPLRPVGDNENVNFGEGGVTGSSERDHKGKSPNLSNVYYLVNPYDMQLVMGCGPIDTKMKAQQLAASLIKAGEKVPGDKKRFVVHQFDTFKTEGYLMTRTPDLVVHAEECLKNALGKDTSLLHINTALSAASTLPAEHDQSFMQINIESLAMIGSYVFEDIEKTFAAQEIVQLKDNQEMKNYSSLLQHMNQVTKFADQIKIDKAGIRSSFSPPVPEEQQQTQILAESTYYRQHSLEQSLMIPKQAGSAYPSLERSQNQLKAALSELYAQLDAVIDEFDTRVWCHRDDAKEERRSLFQKSKLLLKLLKMNLGYQLKAQNMPKVSRCTEIELLLLTYKMLNIHVVLTCRNGLDRGAVPKAMYSALSNLEQKLHTKAKGIVKSEEAKEQIAKVLTYEKLFDIITHQDTMRDTLFTIINSMGTFASAVIEDLQQLDKPTLATSLNNQLEETIKAHCANDEELGSRLRCALLYQELFTVNLFAGMLKTLFSTGVSGMKWHHDASYLAGEYANFHPLERLAMFLHLKDKNSTSTTPVRLMHYSKGGRVFAKSLRITQAAIQIFLRLNQLREG